MTSASPYKTNLSLFNSLTGRQEPFEPVDGTAGGNKVRMYVCGPTVYDEPHLGHARCYITWDVLYRLLKYLGYEVTYARNVTDVDDKIIARAEKEGVAPATITNQYYEHFIQAMRALNVLDPDSEPRATDYIQQMLEGIQVLIEKGSAYATSDGSVYFRVHTKADYGKLSRKPLEDLKAGARVEVDSGKEDPMDFALWKGVSVENSSDIKWASPWGWGRPGWHMECSAMNMAMFGPQIDIHAGGADLLFPHHENEIAQSEAWTGVTPFARFWLHNGFVNVSGEKMSKSLGNFATIGQVLARYDANTIRYFLLTHHYRMPVDFHDQALEGAQNRVIKLHRALKSAVQKLDLEEHSLFSSLVWPYARKYGDDAWQVDFTAFNTAMMDDLNTPQALACMNRVIDGLNNTEFKGYPSPEEGLKRTLAVALALFHILGFSTAPLFQAEEALLPTDSLLNLYHAFHSEKAPESSSAGDLLTSLIELRQLAKTTKNWSLADAIRDRLSAEAGIQLMDRKDGTTTWEKRPDHV